VTAQIIDGKASALRLRERVKAAAAELVASHGRTPGLAVVLVGDDPASKVYVAGKLKATKAAGMVSLEHRLPADSVEADVVALVERLNADPGVDGILVQLPLPKQVDPDRVVAAIDPKKDVDGLTSFNAGRLATGRPGLRPCTPAGCVLLARETLGELAGLRVVIVGRSLLVGRPAALMFLAEDCTVTVAHSKTRDLPAVCREADILVAAVGRTELVQGDWVKPGACVLDVGINRAPAPEKGPDGYRIVGDVTFEDAKEVAGWITPVPGGVGPMTIATLLRNTVTAACLREGWPEPAGL
jgi:methylenetetrahydrofolate dehydrogenase (NADP+)/methenyltetrahydrofolate cyclohydrolase